MQTQIEARMRRLCIENWILEFYLSLFWRATKQKEIRLEIFFEPNPQLEVQMLLMALPSVKQCAALYNFLHHTEWEHKKTQRVSLLHSASYLYGGSTSKVGWHSRLLSLGRTNMEHPMDAAGVVTPPDWDIPCLDKSPNYSSSEVLNSENGNCYDKRFWNIFCRTENGISYLLYRGYTSYLLLSKISLRN